MRAKIDRQKCGVRRLRCYVAMWVSKKCAESSEGPVTCWDVARETSGPFLLVRDSDVQSLERVPRHRKMSEL